MIEIKEGLKGGRLYYYPWDTVKCDYVWRYRKGEQKIVRFSSIDAANTYKRLSNKESR